MRKEAGLIFRGEGIERREAVGLALRARGDFGPAARPKPFVTTNSEVGDTGAQFMIGRLDQRQAVLRCAFEHSPDQPPDVREETGLVGVSIGRSRQRAEDFIFQAQIAAGRAFIRFTVRARFVLITIFG